MSRLHDFEIKDGMLIHYNGSDKKVTVPGIVTALGLTSFQNSDVEEVIVENGIREINPFCFTNCPELRKVILPDSVETINRHAFENCPKLTQVILPDTVDTAGRIFSKCPLLADENGLIVLNGILYGYDGEPKNITLDKSIRAIKPYAFEKCMSLISVTINSDITNLPAWVFYNCTSLEKVILNNNILRINNYAFAECYSLSEITFPQSLLSIGVSAFACCSSLKEITIPCSVSFINGGTFDRCKNLEKVSILSDRVCFSTSCFNDTPALKEITVKTKNPTEKKRIYRDVLKSRCIANAYLSGKEYNADLEEQIISYLQLKKNRDYFAHKACTTKNEPMMNKLLSVQKKPSLDSLNNYEEIASKSSLTMQTLISSFINEHFSKDQIDENEDEKLNKELGLTTKTLSDWRRTFSLRIYNDTVIITKYKKDDKTVYIPDYIDKYRVTQIEINAFTGKNVEKIRFPKYLHTVSSFTFDSCTNLKSLDFRDTELISIGCGAFARCDNLAEIFFPETLITINWNAFSNCKSLTRIEIPASVDTLQSYAFSGCSSLKEVILHSKVKTIGDNCFSYCTSLEKIDYSMLGDIGMNAFFGCTKLTGPGGFVINGTRLIKYEGKQKTVFIPDGVTEICGGAFYSDRIINFVRIPKSVRIIGDNTFAECQNLIEITLPSSVKKIGMGCFKNCSSLLIARLNCHLDTIPYGAFKDCSSLRTITIPFGVTSIQTDAFRNCVGLIKAEFPRSVRSIKEHAFSNCKKLQSPELPPFLEELGNEAFKNCKAIEKIAIPGKVTNLPVRCFEDCDKLERISLPIRLQKIAEYVFSGCKSLKTVIFNSSDVHIHMFAFGNCKEPVFYCKKGSVEQEYAEKRDFRTVNLN